ncbi:NEDD8 ultimate buster 1 [Trichoplax sp. H2]|nr:NEDD8 ultimate buster 1 [Trichoplax sp. H2]|eukprot:RDD45242.1 NEDD8 ultimate buster 1 [Trichoplax sp. H2]
MDERKILIERIRKQLLKDDIKLWLPPYTKQGDESSHSLPEELIERYSSFLQISSKDVSEVLENLRSHALKKIQGNKRFQQHGIATLNIQVAKTGRNQKLTSTSTADKYDFQLDIHLSNDGKELRKSLMDKLDCRGESIKMISNGRLIEDGCNLTDQNIKHNGRILVVKTAKLDNTEDNISTKISQARKVATTLSKRADDGKYEGHYMEIRDQNGVLIPLQSTTKKSLVIAMSLHELARSYIDRKNYTEALPLLFEADKEFNQCDADILNCVDNYANLCLDIVWCYMRIKCLDYLSDAELRLRKCAQCFSQCYGQNMERLTAIKGCHSHEIALFARLHLLQGVVAYHKGDKSTCQRLLIQAENEMEKLMVKEESLTQLMVMGFSSVEARLGLRSSNGNVEKAIGYIMDRQRERKKRKEIEREERQKKRKRERLGKTVQGEWVNAELYDSLVSMGHDKELVAEALRQSENDIVLALQNLNMSYIYFSSKNSAKKNTVSKEALNQLTAMGFDAKKAKSCLLQHNGNIERAIDELSSQMPMSSGSSTDESDLEKSALNNMDVTEDFDDGEDISEDDEDKEELEKSIETILPDLAKDEEDYLNLSLNEECEILQEYKILLASLK